MRLKSIALAAWVAIAFVSTAGAADNKKLLVGKWEVIKGEQDIIGAIAEFTADGKFTLKMKQNGKDFTLEGSYTVDGDSFTLKTKVDGKDILEKNTIKKISETELDAVDPEGKSTLLKRVK